SGQQPLDLGSEVDPFRLPCPVERSFPSAVPAENQLARTEIVYCDRPHPIQLFKATIAPDNIRLGQDLSVGSGYESGARCSQLFSKLDVVIDLAVQHEAYAT